MDPVETQIQFLPDTDFKWRANYARTTVHGADLLKVPVTPAYGTMEQVYDWKRFQANMMTCPITMIPSRWLTGWLPCYRSLGVSHRLVRCYGKMSGLEQSSWHE